MTPPPLTPEQAAILELLDRVERLERELRAVRGQVANLVAQDRKVIPLVGVVK